MTGGATPPDAAAGNGSTADPSRRGGAVPGDNGDAFDVDAADAALAEAVRRAQAEAARRAAQDAKPKTPPLDESLRGLADTGSKLFRSAWDTFRAFRALIVADLALSRSAAGRVLVLAAIGTALGASTWLFGMGLLVVILRSFELPWWAAVAIPTGLSLIGTLLCGWLALRAFELTRFQATRRQLAKLGIGDDPAAVDRNPEQLQ